LKVYDCFTFFNELDILEIRLNELDPVVDYFVLVEATKTFSGQPKKLIFHENNARYSAFLDKIIHVVVDDMPPVLTNDRWKLEIYQRRSISRALTKCENDDIILISDVDEIPDVRILESIIERVHKESLYNDFKELLYYANYLLSEKVAILYVGKLIHNVLKKLNSFIMPCARIYRFHHRHHEYYLNGYVNDDIPGMAVIRFSSFRRVFNMDAHAPRKIWHNSDYQIVRGGWHFSYLGGPENIKQKIHSFAHSEFDTEMFTNTNRIETLIEKGENLFGKVGERHNIKYIPITQTTHPKYVVENRQRLSKYIKEI
jgi:beta-1,4-mannosyl-glycoprotein beta-1,4-N-acetylglucosaminyltransferase